MVGSPVRPASTLTCWRRSCSLLHADGYWVRRWVMSACLALHGGRMFFGALVLFWPLRWKQDLPRYQYTKLRWERDGMPASSWPLKLLHDALQQVRVAAVGALVCPPQPRVPRSMRQHTWLPPKPAGVRQHHCARGAARLVRFRSLHYDRAARGVRLVRLAHLVDAREHRRL